MSDKILCDIGKWYSEYDENGVCTKAVYDDEYRRLLGIDSLSDENDTDDAWKRIVHPDDLTKIEANAVELFSKHPEGLDYDLEYRMMTGKGYRWFHDYAHCTRRKDGSIIRMDGVIFDIQDIVDKANAQKLLAESNTRILALEDTLEVLYDVELETGKYDIFVKGQVFGDVNKKLINNNSFFDDVKKNLNVVHPEDRQGNFDTTRPDFIRKTLANDDHFDRYYRLMVDGQPAWAKMRIVYKNAEKKNIIIGVFNAESDVEAKQIAEQKAKLEEALTFTNFFLDTYVSAYYVNLADKSCKVYKRTEGLEKNYPIITDYYNSLTEYINKDVHPDDRDALFEFVRPERMNKLLTEKTEYSHIFRDISNGKEKTYRLQVIRGADSNHAAFGFIDISEEVNEQKGRMKEAEDSRKLIESIAASYNVAYAVNICDDSFRLLRMDDNVIGKGEKFNTFTEAKNFFISILPECDKEWMRNELDYGTIKEKLAETESYNVEYRVPIKGAIIWHEMNVTHIDEEHVAISFVSKDLEITKNHLEDKRFGEYFALYEVDIDSGMAKIVKDSPWYGVSKAGTALPYTQEFMKFATTLDDEPRKFFEQLAQLDYIKSLFASEDKHTYAYRSSNIGKKKWVECTSIVTLRHRDGTPAMFTLGFNLLDSLGVYRQELQSRLNENMQMIGGLATGYDTLYYINIDADIFRIYNVDESKLSDVKQLVDNSKGFFDALTTYGSSNMVHPDDRHLFANFSADDFRKRLAHAKRFELRFRHKLQDEYRWIVMEVVKYEAIDEQANAIAIGFVNRDAEIRSEQEQQRQLKESHDAAEAANAAKTNFLFSMSHDIRTPMNAIAGFTNMAIKHIDDKNKALDCLTKIQKSGSMLLSLINSVLEVSQIESGKATLDEQPGDVFFSFANIDHTLLELAKTNDIELTFDFGEIKDRFIYADFSRCMRIFVNVISNGIKYTHEGGFVKVHCEQIGTAKDGYATYKYTVTDNGIGMSEEFQKHVFEQFARENTATVSGIQGTGLGMTVVKSFVELMGGSVSVESKQGVGTTFTIILPFKLQQGEMFIDPDTGDVVTSYKQPESPNNVDLEGKKVLLVEDNELNREIAVEILGEEGLVIEEAEDGSQAVELLKQKGPAYYDFILMDIQMPIMNGYEATKTIRKMYPDAKIPIIALSANAFAEDKAASLAAGMNDHVAKPIKIKELFTALAKYI